MEYYINELNLPQKCHPLKPERFPNTNRSLQKFLQQMVTNRKVPIKTFRFWERYHYPDKT